MGVRKTWYTVHKSLEPKPSAVAVMSPPWVCRGLASQRTCTHARAHVSGVSLCLKVYGYSGAIMAIKRIALNDVEENEENKGLQKEKKWKEKLKSFWKRARV